MDQCCVRASRSKPDANEHNRVHDGRAGPPGQRAEHLPEGRPPIQVFIGADEAGDPHDEDESIGVGYADGIVGDDAWRREHAEAGRGGLAEEPEEKALGPDAGQGDVAYNQEEEFEPGQYVEVLHVCVVCLVRRMGKT